MTKFDLPVDKLGLLKNSLFLRNPSEFFLINLEYLVKEMQTGSLLTSQSLKNFSLDRFKSNLLYYELLRSHILGYDEIELENLEKLRINYFRQLETLNPEQ